MTRFLFGANISMLFRELPLLERVEAAHAAGFDGVECWWPYDVPASHLAERMARTDLSFRMINSPAGPSEFGGRGLAAIAGAEQLFRDGMARAFDYATALGVRHIHVMSGLLPVGADPGRAFDTLVANLHAAATIVRGSEVHLLVEAICPQATPGYFLDSLRLAVAACSALDCPAIGLLYDDFHATMLGEDRALPEFAAKIRHVQAASIPGRNEPREIAALLNRLHAVGYSGWISGEYNPKISTVEGLAWLRAAQRWSNLG